MPYPLTWPTGWPRVAALAAAPFHRKVDTGRSWSNKAAITMAPFRAELQAELEQRKAELTPNDGALSADNPTAREGRDDADMGDTFSDDRSDA